MKAAILTRYDKNATDLEVREIPTPAPASNEVLVKIHTAAVNRLFAFKGVGGGGIPRSGGGSVGGSFGG